MSKRPHKLDTGLVQLTLPLSSLPSRQRAAGSLRTSEAVKEALGQALRSCGLSRELIADELTRLTGEPVSVHAVNNWAAARKHDRSIPLDQLAALCVITGSEALARAALAPAELLVLTQDDAALYELGRLTAEDRARARRKKDLWEQIKV